MLVEAAAVAIAQGEAHHDALYFRSGHCGLFARPAVEMVSRGRSMVSSL